MTDFKHIEEQIADMRAVAFLDRRSLAKIADTMQAMLDERTDLKQRCAVIASGSPPAGWEALAPQDMWDVCFGAALLAVQAELDKLRAG